MRETVPVGEATKGPSAAERAYGHLLRRVTLRLVLPGERLGAAKDLATEIGVSRPVVLQALQRLQDEGWVEVGTGRKGVTVLPIQSSRSHWETAARDRNWAELGALVEIIDPGIARVLARQDLDPTAVAEARDLIASMRAAIDPQARLGLHNRFHLVLCKATGMKTLDALGDMSRILNAQVFDLADLEVPAPDALARQHDQLLNAILARDAARAADLADDHVDAVREALAAFTAKPPPVRRRTAPRRQVGRST